MSALDGRFCLELASWVPLTFWGGRGRELSGPRRGRPPVMATSDAWLSSLFIPVSGPDSQPGSPPRKRRSTGPVKRVNFGLPSPADDKSSNSSFRRTSSPDPPPRALLRIEGLLGGDIMESGVGLGTRLVGNLSTDGLVTPPSPQAMRSLKGLRPPHTPVDLQDPADAFQARVPPAPTERAHLEPVPVAEGSDSTTDDVRYLLELAGQDKRLEGQQLCHRCGKRGKSAPRTRTVCQSSFCSLNGKRFSICGFCIARYSGRPEFRLMMGNPGNTGWHCPRCISAHFLSGTGICCCSFVRRGMRCPWHADDMRLCCAPARQSTNKRKRKSEDGADADRSTRMSARKRLCAALDRSFDISKICIVNERERCYKGFPCPRCQRNGNTSAAQMASSDPSSANRLPPLPCILTSGDEVGHDNGLHVRYRLDEQDAKGPRSPGQAARSVIAADVTRLENDIKAVRRETVANRGVQSAIVEALSRIEAHLGLNNVQRNAGVESSSSSSSLERNVSQRRAAPGSPRARLPLSPTRARRGCDD